VTALALPSRSFVCLRHGVTDWNKQGRFQGLTDNALNEDGIAQAHAAAQRLKDVAIGAIVASPLRRAVQTADIVAAALAKQVSIDAGIIECDFGSLEGQSIDEAMREHGITAMKDLVSILPADGEAWHVVSDRALRCVAAWQDRQPGDDMLFVCHDGVMQAIAEVLCGSFFANHQGMPFRYTRAGNTWTVEEVG